MRGKSNNRFKLTTNEKGWILYDVGNSAYQSIIKFDGFLNNACELDKAFNYSFGSVLIEGCDNNQKQCISDNIQNVESFIKKEVQYEG